MILQCLIWHACIFCVFTATLIVTTCNNVGLPSLGRYTRAMKFLKAFVAIAITFTVIDIAWISLYLGDIYKAQLASIMRTSPLTAPAMMFYIGYIVAIIYFAVRPALATQKLATAVLNGGALGAVTYGTFTLTNHAILSAWSWSLVISDIAWGTFLTGICSACGYLATKRTSRSAGA